MRLKEKRKTFSRPERRSSSQGRGFPAPRTGSSSTISSSSRRPKRSFPTSGSLGITDIYASPYFLAKKGSLHGYDILDQNRLNPEIGTEEEYEELTRELQKCGLGQVLDIVPNHMSIAGSENSWWMDVLENGPGSIYAGFFDIDWKPVKEELENKVLLPILGDQYGQVLEDQGLVLKFEAGRFFVCVYGEQNLPLDPLSYNRILKLRLEDLEKDLGKENADLQEFLSIITAVDHLPPQTEKDPAKIEERRREKEVIKKRTLALYERSEPIRAFLDENLRIFNGEKGKGPTFNLLDDLLKVQAYRLAYWRVATEEINYRRFFDINELAAIRMELLPVFREAHKLIFKLLREGKLTGLRVDHPDGLYNPSEYFFRLQKGCFTQICLRAAEREKGEAGEGPPAPDDEALEKALGDALRGGGAKKPVLAPAGAVLHRGRKDPDQERAHAGGLADLRDNRLQFSRPGDPGPRGPAECEGL